MDNHIHQKDEEGYIDTNCICTCQTRLRIYHISYLRAKLGNGGKGRGGRWGDKNIYCICICDDMESITTIILTLGKGKGLGIRRSGCGQAWAKGECRVEKGTNCI